MAGIFKASKQLRNPAENLIVKPDLIISEDNSDQILLNFE